MHSAEDTVWDCALAGTLVAALVMLVQAAPFPAFVGPVLTACVAGIVTGIAAMVTSYHAATIALQPFEALQRELRSLNEQEPSELTSQELADALHETLVRDRLVQAEGEKLQSQMRSLLEHACVGLVITVERRIIIVSRAFCTMFGYEEAQLLGQPGRMIYPSDEAYAEIGPRVGAAFAEHGRFDTEIQLMRSDGSLFWCQMTGRPVDTSNMAAGTAWVLYDITEMRAQREQLEWASYHDPLTGLANRAAFERALDRAMCGPLRGGSGAHASMLMLDLDRFKLVNDGGGHGAGDQLLKDLAKVMTKRLRQSDVVARIGGDEFAVLLDNCDRAQALSVAESLRKQISDYRLKWGGQDYSVGVSIGVIAIEAEMKDRESLLAAADAACYEAKKAGRDQVCLARSWHIGPNPGLQSAGEPLPHRTNAA